MHVGEIRLGVRNVEQVLVDTAGGQQKTDGFGENSEVTTEQISMLNALSTCAISCYDDTSLPFL